MGTVSMGSRRVEALPLLLSAKGLLGRCCRALPARSVADKAAPVCSAPAQPSVSDLNYVASRVGPVKGEKKYEGEQESPVERGHELCHCPDSAWCRGQMRRVPGPRRVKSMCKGPSQASMP